LLVTDYGGQDCGNQNTTVSLVGCPEDYMKPSQLGETGFPMLVGKWDFVNKTSMGSSTDNMTSAGISGTMTFAKNGDVKMDVPNKTSLGDYTLDASWGYIGHGILTQCYAGGCENSTLTAEVLTTLNSQITTATQYV
jgi:hypothetical protein